MQITEHLTTLEKHLGLEPVEVPENVADLVEVRTFTKADLLAYLRKEYIVSKGLSEEDAAVYKSYLGELIALAKFQFNADPSAQQVKLPVAQKWGPSEMRMWRVFQNGAAPRMSGGGFQFEKSDDAPAATDAPAALSVDDVATLLKSDEFIMQFTDAFLNAVSKQTEGTPEIPVEGAEPVAETAEDLNKSDETPAETPAATETPAETPVAKAADLDATDEQDQPKYAGGSYIPATEDLSDPDFDISSLAGK